MATSVLKERLLAAVIDSIAFRSSQAAVPDTRRGIGAACARLGEDGGRDGQA
jgi:hypothetical protein